MLTKTYDLPETPFKNMKEALKFAVNFNQKLISSTKDSQQALTRLQDAELIIKQQAEAIEELLCQRA